MFTRGQLFALWLLWFIVCGGTIASLAKGPSIREQYAELLHSFLHRPFHSDKPTSMPVHLQHQQQEMLDAMHRNQHADLHRMLQQNEQHGVAGSQTSRQTAAAPEPAGRPALAGNATGTDIMHNLQASWPEGYMAICAVVKDQNKDLRYWVEYHRWLGVSKFYIFDNNSTLPAMLVLWDYIQQGIVEYQYFRGRPRRLPDFRDTNQYKAYHGCLLQHFRQHRWLAFIDIDEFFVFPPANAAAVAVPAPSSKPQPSTDGRNMLSEVSSISRAVLPSDSQAATSLGARQATGAQLRGRPAALHRAAHRTLLQQPESSSSSNAADSPAPVPASDTGLSKQNIAVFLSKYEQHAAIGVNWVLFGSSGLQDKPKEGPLAAFTSCVPQEHWESTHVKVIANTGGILGVGPTPHEVVPRAGRSTVDIDGVPFKGPKTPKSKWHKLIIHHYVLKSRSEFAAKKARGSGAGNVKEWSFFNYMDDLSNMTCTWGQPISRAFFSSRPRLRPPRGDKSICGLRNKLQIEAAAVSRRNEGGETAPMPVDGGQLVEQQQGRKQQGTERESVAGTTGAADDRYDVYG